MNFVKVDFMAVLGSLTSDIAFIPWYNLKDCFGSRGEKFILEPLPFSPCATITGNLPSRILESVHISQNIYFQERVYILNP